MGKPRNEPDLYQRESGVWYVSFYDHHGKRLRLSTHQTIRAQAVKDARRIQDEYRTRHEHPQPKTLTLVDGLTAFISSRERVDRSKSTIKFYDNKARRLMQIFGPGLDVHALTTAHTERYLDVRRKAGRAFRTIQMELGLLVSALNYARRTDAYVGDPKRLIPDGLDGSSPPRERVLTLSEYHRLRAALSENRRPYLDVFVGLGVRDSELYRIRPSGVSADGSVVHVPGTKTKGSNRAVQVHPSLHSMLKERAKRMQSEPYLFPFWGNVRRDLHAACARAGIAPLSPNDLRRTFASWLAEAGVSEMQIAQMMGHTTSGMVRRVYAKIGSAAQAAAAAKLPALGSPSPEAASTHA